MKWVAKSQVTQLIGITELKRKPGVIPAQLLTLQMEHWEPLGPLTRSRHLIPCPFLFLLGNNSLKGNVFWYIEKNLYQACHLFINRVSEITASWWASITREHVLRRTGLQNMHTITLRKCTLEACSLILVKLEFPLYASTINIKVKSQSMQKYNCHHKA